MNYYRQFSSINSQLCVLFFSGIWGLTDATYVGNSLQGKTILHSTEKSTIFINVQIVLKPSQQSIRQNRIDITAIINREEVKRGRANLLNPDRQRKDESQRQITQQETTELPLLVNRKCGNSTQRPTDIEFNFKIWKSGICLTSYKVCVASFPQ